MKTKTNLLRKEDDSHVTRARKILEKIKGKQERSHEKMSNIKVLLADTSKIRSLSNEKCYVEKEDSDLASICSQSISFEHNDATSSQTNDESNEEIFGKEMFLDEAK